VDITLRSKLTSPLTNFFFSSGVERIISAHSSTITLVAAQTMLKHSCTIQGDRKSNNKPELDELSEICGLMRH